MTTSLQGVLHALSDEHRPVCGPPPVPAPVILLNFLVIASWLLEQAFRVVITADSLGLPDVG